MVACAINRSTRDSLCSMNQPSLLSVEVLDIKVAICSVRATWKQKQGSELHSPMKRAKVCTTGAKIIQVSGCPFRFCDGDEFQCSSGLCMGCFEWRKSRMCPEHNIRWICINKFNILSSVVRFQHFIYIKLFRRPLAKFSKVTATFYKKTNRINFFRITTGVRRAIGCWDNV